MITYKNQWALITGASSGIGESFAHKLAEKGANLILVARREERLKESAEKLRKKYAVEVDVIALDLATPTAPHELFGKVAKSNRFVSILINNAGMGVHGLLHETDIEKNSNLIMLNVYALAILTQLFLTPMAQKKSGVIVNVASVAAFQPLPYMATYAASKAFVLSFTEAIYSEYEKKGVRILALCPGPVKTEFFQAMNESKLDFGEMDQPETIVNETFAALEKNKSYLIPGMKKNFLQAQLVKFVPRKLVLNISKKILGPKNQ